MIYIGGSRSWLLPEGPHSVDKKGQKASCFHPELKQEREVEKHVKQISMEESFEISDDLLIQVMKE